MLASPATMLVPALLALVHLSAGVPAGLGLGLGQGDLPGEPNPIYEADQYTKQLKAVKNGALLEVATPGDVQLRVLHLWGDARERGTAQGELLAEELQDFLEVQLPEFYRSEVDQIPLQKLPPALQTAIKALLKGAAPQAFALALGYVYKQQKDHIAASAAHVWDETDGIVAGMCAVLGPTAKVCDDVQALQLSLRHLNMLPELIQMQCSMMGAWGKAVPAANQGKLVQLRTLDFGNGPWANRTLLTVNHPTDSKFDFATLSFPGFVGVVTGFSENIAQSEKVDDVTGGARPKGSYQGQAVSMVIRDMLQFATDKDDAIAIAQKAKRTWSVWLGIGDFKADTEDETRPPFDALLYDQAAALPFDDTTLPALTHQTAFDSVAYIDKHPQPSTHPDMPALIQRFYGNLSADNVASYLPRLMQSGDVHVSVYDIAAKRVLLAAGRTDSTGTNFTRLACDAPFVAFNTDALWARQPPPSHE